MLFTLAVYVHDLNPYALKLWEGGPIRWYGLSYLLGFALAYLLIRRVTKVGVSSLKTEHAADLVVAAALGLVVGGRLGYVFFYDLSLLTTFSSSPPFWGVLQINRGGMASHGAMIGALLATWWYAYRHGHRFLFLLDLIAFSAPLGVFFGRIANFVNGELYGRPAPADLPFAVKFPQEMLHWGPAFEADKLRELGVRVAELHPPPEGISPGNLTFVAREQVPWVIQQIQEGTRGMRQKLIGTVSDLLAPRHPSQIYEALLEGLVVFAVLALVWWKPRKPGVVAGSFLVTYGIVRIIGEFFREPDFHIRAEEFARWGVTRGQWLSLFVVLGGLIMIAWAMRRAVPRMGSWRRVTDAERQATSDK